MTNPLKHNRIEPIDKVRREGEKQQKSFHDKKNYSHIWQMEMSSIDMQNGFRIYLYNISREVDEQPYQAHK